MILATRELQFRVTYLYKAAKGTSMEPDGASDTWAHAHLRRPVGCPGHFALSVTAKFMPSKRIDTVAAGACFAHVTQCRDDCIVHV